MFDTRNRGFLNPEEFKLMISFIFNFKPRSRIAKEYNLRILSKLGKTVREDIPQDLIIDYLVERGCLESRKVANVQEFYEDQMGDHSYDTRQSFMNSPMFQSMQITNRPTNEMTKQ